MSQGPVPGPFLQCAVAAACVVFFRRRKHRGELWSNQVGPSIAAVVLSGVVVLALVNYPLLSGTRSTFINSLPWIIPVLIVLGVGYALWLRAYRPATYRGIAEGRAPAPYEPAPVAAQRVDQPYR